jgi:hypothetical protein
MLKQLFEKFGFWVLDKNIQCMSSEIAAEDKALVDYVVEFKYMAYIHKYFLNDFKLFMKSEIESIFTERVLYFNDNMGMVNCEEMIVVAYDKDWEYIDIFPSVHNSIYIEGAVVAVEVTDIEFVQKQGVFLTEGFSKQMLEDGNWKV